MGRSLIGVTYISLVSIGGWGWRHLQQRRKQAIGELVWESIHERRRRVKTVAKKEGPLESVGMVIVSFSCEYSRVAGFAGFSDFAGASSMTNTVSSSLIITPSSLRDESLSGDWAALSSFLECIKESLICMCVGNPSL